MPAPIRGGGAGSPGRPEVIGRDGTTRPAPCGAAARRTSGRLRLPARAVAPEGFELGEVSVRISRLTRTITGLGKEATDCRSVTCEPALAEAELSVMLYLLKAI